MNRFADILRSMAAMVALMAIVVLATACSDSVGSDQPDVVGPVRQVGFTITVADVPESDKASRATPADGDYDRGEGYENYINIADRDFRFLFFSIDDKYVGEIQVNSLNPIEINPLQQSKTYEVLGQIDAGIGQYNSFKVCVLANWRGSYPVLTEGDRLSKLWDEADANIYSYNGSALSQEHTIPLYGIQEYENMTLEPDRFTSLGRIHLLRAYAKVEVSLDKTVYPVKGLYFTRVNDRGFKAPANVTKRGDYVHGAYEEDYANTPNVPATSAVIENIPMTLVAGRADQMEPRKFVAYVPEYRNIDASAPSRILVDYVSDEIAEKSYIDFKYYAATANGKHLKDEPFDLLRNYWYRYNVKQGVLDLDLTVYVDVQPYALVVLKPDLGLERDEDGYIIVRNNKGEVIKYIRTDGAELTLEPLHMPFYGTIMGVFDSKRKALLGYLPNNRKVYYNYEDEFGKVMTSWEIYSSENDKDIDVHLEEDYIKAPDNSHIEQFTQTFYDDKGRVIERYQYPSNEVFEARTREGDGAVQLVSYTGNKYGEKVITYVDKNGKKYCEIKVTVSNGKETETYTYYD